MAVILYWTDGPGSKVFKFDGTATTAVTPTVFGAPALGPLATTPDGDLQVAWNPDWNNQDLPNNGVLSGADLQTYTPWPDLYVPRWGGGAPIRANRQKEFGAAIYEPVEDVYWLYVFDSVGEWYSWSEWKPWVKVDRDGAFLSTHVGPTWDFTHEPRSLIGVPVVSGDYLYWTTEMCVWRYNKVTDETHLVFTDTAGNAHRFRYELIGILPDGRFVFFTRDSGAGPGVSFDIVDMTSAAWASALYPTNPVEMPFADVAYPVESPTIIKMLDQKCGTDILVDTTVYYGVWDDAVNGGDPAIHAMDMNTGESSLYWASDTNTDYLMYIRGMMAVASEPLLSGVHLGARRRFT